MVDGAFQLRVVVTFGTHGGGRLKGPVSLDTLYYLGM